MTAKVPTKSLTQAIENWPWAKVWERGENGQWWVSATRPVAWAFSEELRCKECGRL